jgi:hypothetical protein
VYGPVRTVVWQGSAGDRGPYADQTGIWEVMVRVLSQVRRKLLSALVSAHQRPLPSLTL